MYVVYILYSKKHKKTYVGYTSNLFARMKSHNELGRKGYTKNYRPWEVLHSEKYETKKEAMQKEKYYKSGVGREAIKELVEKYEAESSYPPRRT